MFAWVESRSIIKEIGCHLYRPARESHTIDTRRWRSVGHSGMSGGRVGDCQALGAHTVNTRYRPTLGTPKMCARNVAMAVTR